MELLPDSNDSRMNNNSLITDLFYIIAGLPQVLPGHFWIEMMLDVEVKAAVVPVHPFRRLQVHVGQNLELVPAQTQTRAYHRPHHDRRQENTTAD